MWVGIYRSIHLSIYQISKGKKEMEREKEEGKEKGKK
jgi:hypothetical protein